MFINSQRLNYKICPIDQRYSRKLQQNLASSNGTFSDLQTPGWSSLMKSQISERTRRTDIGRQNQGLRETDIYNKLNKADKLKWSSKDEKKMVRNKNADKNDTRDSEYAKHLSFGGKLIAGCKQKQVKSQRWNQITVHEHLYRNSFKMQNKKIANKLLDEEFKKKQIYRFTPIINKKSIILAESKFSRVKGSHVQEKMEQNTLQTQATECRQKQDKEVQRYRLLNKVFYFLSQQKTLLTQQSLQNTIHLLPMPCINVIQPIISKIYQGKKLEWLDFLQQFNDKKIKGKQGFYSLIFKWLQRSQKLDKNQSNKYIKQ